MTIPEQKEKLRQEMRTRLAEMDERKRKKESDDICKRLHHLLPDPCDICAYMPLADEVDITPLLRTLLEQGFGLYLPRYAEGRITFHAVTSLDQELIEGAFAIAEPHPHLPVHDPASITSVLVPGRAFDDQGNRLGRGKGGYDRWIEKQHRHNPHTRFIGIAFDEQIVPQVPAEPHDQPMDIVLTAARTLETSRV